MEAATVEQLAVAPVGRYSSGRTFFHFCVHPTLWGVVLWGRPDGDDLVSLGRSLVLELASEVETHASIVDARRIEGIDSGAFQALQAYVGAHHEALRRKVARLALVRPSGLEGAVVAGFFEVMPPPYPVETFADPGSALRWLCAQEAQVDAGTVERELEELFAECSGVSPVVRDLRAVLGRHIGGIGIGDAARTMGLSERTLQRRLSEAKTTFVDELTHARLRAAQKMMLDSDAPLTAIALDVGCASLQHFSAMFRRLTGESPSSWRDRRRGA